MSPTWLDAALTATTPTGSWLISELRRAGAVSPDTAQPIRHRDARIEYALDQLLGLGIVVEESAGLYYLDEHVLAPVAARVRRYRIGLIALVIALLVSAVVRFLLEWR